MDSKHHNYYLVILFVKIQNTKISNSDVRVIYLLVVISGTNIIKIILKINF